MRAVLQRVKEASVSIEGTVTGQVGPGLAILLGVSLEDTKTEAELLAEKCVKLRIFPDNEDKLNLSILDVRGEALVVSNFTLYADARKGRRPSYIRAARPQEANALYEYFVECLRGQGVGKVDTGSFGADMLVNIQNDGPVTIILDTEELTPKSHKTGGVQ